MQRQTKRVVVERTVREQNAPRQLEAVSAQAHHGALLEFLFLFPMLSDRGVHLRVVEVQLPWRNTKPLGWP